MENGNDLLTLGFGVLVFLIGLVLVIIRILKVRRNKVIKGEIVDRRLWYKDRYFPVIKYEVKNETRTYQSSQTTIFQVIGGKIRLVYNEEDDYIVATFGELFFLPVMVMVVGVFITTVMILYLNQPAV